MSPTLPLVAVVMALVMISSALADVATHPFPGKVEADLWVLAGQSNMQGAGLITKKDKADSRIMMLTLGGKWIPATQPTHRLYDFPAPPVFKKKILEKNPALTEEGYQSVVEAAKKTPLGGVGPDLFFAKHVLKYTGRHIGLIPCAMGGTSMAEWDPASKNEGTSSLYGSMLQRIADVGGGIKGLLWYQGESDANPTLQATFEKSFLNFVDSVRRDTGIPDLPIIYVQISRFCLENHDGDEPWEQIREHQRLAAGKRKNLYVVPAIDLPLDDLIHIGTAGQERLGRRMAEVALGKVYGQDGHATTIDFQSYEMLPKIDDNHSRMRIRFSGVNGKLVSKGDPTGFQLRSDDPNRDGPCVFKVELDPKDPASVIVWYTKPITRPARLYYGPGIDPYVNIVDSRDMAVPAFGPRAIAPESAGK